MTNQQLSANVADLESLLAATVRKEMEGLRESLSLGQRQLAEELKGSVNDGQQMVLKALQGHFQGIRHGQTKVIPPSELPRQAEVMPSPEKEQQQKPSDQGLVLAAQVEQVAGEEDEEIQVQQRPSNRYAARSQTRQISEWERSEEVGRLKWQQEPERSGCFADLLRSPRFYQFCSSVVFVDVLVSLIVAAVPAMLGAFRGYINMVVLSWYSMELLLRFVVHRLFFFCNKRRAWNILDLFVVGASVVEMTVFGQDQTSTTVLRVFRAVRFSKFVRLFGLLDSLSDLGLMLRCTLGSMVPVFWTLCFLLVILVVFGLIFSECFKEPGSSYGTLPNTMLQLFMAVTGGLSWGEIYHRINDENGVFYSTLFLSYKIFVTFSFMNVVTSVLVQKTMKLGEPGLEQTIIKRRQDEVELAKTLHSVITAHHMGTGQFGMITREDAMLIIEDPEVSKHMALNGINITSTAAFWDAMELLTGGEVDTIDEFIGACLGLTGGASCIDVLALLQRLAKLSKTLEDVHFTLEAEAV